MKLSEGKSILLFRFYKDFDIARERIKIIKHYNPGMPIYGLYGGELGNFQEAKKKLEGLAENFWLYPEDKDPDWKWMHTDIMTKAWYRDIGYTLDFDFLYSYEYDLLTLKPLQEIYPNIDDNTLVLAAVTNLDEWEWDWSWTSTPEKRPNWLKFQSCMEKTYGLKKQKYVCLGPGPLLPRTFLEKFSATEDVDFVHEEITLPAYAEVFGFGLADHGMHPGFALTNEEKFFSCRPSYAVSNQDVIEQLKIPNGRRTFHPVKQKIKLPGIPSY